MLGEVDERLGVPLHAEVERVPVALETLDEAVRRPGDRAQPLAEAVRRLVVEGVDVGLGHAHHAREPRAGLDPHGVGGDAARLGLAVALEVLVQRAAAGDVERLHAAADPEHRHPARVGELGERELVAVERRLGGAELRVALLLAVAVRVDVRAARQADAVEPLERRRDRVVAERREHDRDAAGALDRAHVDHPERHLALRRVALGQRVAVLGEPHLGGGDADQRAAHGSTHVSLAPPFCDELTTSEPSSNATRVSPPGSVRTSPSSPRKT